MVQHNLLLTMMYKQLLILFCSLCSILFYGCETNNPSSSVCSLFGVVGHPSNCKGINVTLKNINVPEIEYVATTDAYGNFYFIDIIPGTYRIDATKDNLHFSMMIENGENLHTKIIELRDGDVREITILMGGSSNVLDCILELTDVHGNPIDNVIRVPKYSSVVSMSIFNGSGESHSWSIWGASSCFISDDSGLQMEYIFESFGPTSGTLKPGEIVTVVGAINQNIFDYASSPRYVYTEFSFASGYSSSRQIHLDIDF